MGLFKNLKDDSNAPLDSTSKREVTEIINRGDADARPEFAGREGWATLKELGVTYLSAPPPVGMGPRPENFPPAQPNLGVSTAVLAAVAAKIAHDENNPELENEILLHLGLCRKKPGGSCLPGPHVPVMPTGRLFDFDVQYFVDNAYTYGQEIASWPSSVGTNVLNRVTFGDPLQSAIQFFNDQFNDKGGVHFDVGSTERRMMIAANQLIMFPNDAGTFAIVFHSDVSVPAVDESPAIITPTNRSCYLFIADEHEFHMSTDTSSKRPIATDYGADPAGLTPLEVPASDIPLADEDPPLGDNTQIWIIQKVGQRMEFRRNGVQKSGALLFSLNTRLGVDDFAIGGLASASKSLIGSYARLIHWDRVLTLPELLDVEEILTDLYIPSV